MKRIFTLRLSFTLLLWSIALVSFSQGDPTGFTAGTVTSTSFQFSWTASTNNDEAYILRSTTATPPNLVDGAFNIGDAFGSSTLIAKIASPTVTYTDNTLSPGTTYYYKIVGHRASNDHNSGGGATGTITTPLISTSGSIAALPTTYGYVSAEGTFTFTASDLAAATETVTVTAPTGFEVSLTSGGAFTTSITKNAVAKAIASTSVFIRVKASASTTPATYSGNVTLSAPSITTAVTIATTASVVSKKNLTMTGLTVAGSKIYDATTAVVVGGSAALLSAEAIAAGTPGDGKPFSGDAVSISGSATGTYDSKDVATATTVTFSGLSLGGAQAANYTFTIQSPAAATITPKALTLSGAVTDNKTFDGTAAAILSSASLGGAESPGSGNTADGLPYTGDAVTVTGSGTGTFTSNGPGVGIAVNTISGFTLGSAQAGNYSPTQPTSSTGTIFSTQPLVPSTLMIFSAVTNTTMNVSWTTNGTGSNRILVVKQGSSPTAPVNGTTSTNSTTYTANTAIGSVTAGEITAAGSYVVYIGSGAPPTVNLTNFNPNTSYTFNLYEFNTSTSGDENYLTSSVLTGTQTTSNEPLNHATALTASATSSAITVSWTAASGSPAPTNYLISARNVTAGGSFQAFSDGVAVPTNDVNLTTGNNGVQSVAFGTNTFNGWTNLTPGNLYEFQVNSYTTTGTPTPDYKTSPAAPTVQVYVEPSGSASAPTFASITPNSIDVTVGGATGIGAAGGYLVIRKATSAPLGTPSDGAVYTNASTIGGDQVVYVGAAGTFTDSGLSALTNYFYDVYAFSGTGAGLTNYKITSPGVANTTTLCTPPVTQATAISFGASTSSSVVVNITRGSGTNVLLLIKQGAASAVSPTSGTAYTASNSAPFSLGSLIAGYNVAYNGSGASVTISNLSGNTAYNFKVFEFNSTGNCYLIGSPATNNFTTPSAGLSSTLTAGTGSATLSSIANTQPTQVTAFTWISTDLGDDGTSSRLSSLTFRLGTAGMGNDPVFTDFTQFVLGAELYDNHGSGPSEHNTAVITSTGITISGINYGDPNDNPDINDLGTIPDGGNKTYTLKLWFKTSLGGSLPTTIDGKHLVLSLSAADITIVSGKSGYAPAATVNSGAANNTFNVTATSIRINQQPSTTATANVALATQPIFEAIDVNLNRDLLNNTLTVGTSNAGIGPASPPAAFISGIANFTGSGFKFANTGTTTMNVSITSPTLTSPNSNSITVTASTNLGNSFASLAVSPLVNSTTLNPVLGFSLNTTGSLTNLTDLVFNSTTSTTNYVKNFKLYINSVDSFSGATQVATSALLNFSGMAIPISSTIQYFFLVCDVESFFPTLPANIQFSLPAGNFTVASGGSKTGSTQTGSFYTFSDQTAPDVQSIVTASATNPWSTTKGTSATSVQFTVTFTEPVFGVTSADFRTVVDGTVTTGPISFSGSGAVYTVTVNSTISGNGHLRLEVKNNSTITDNASNLFRSPGFTDYLTDFVNPAWYYSIVLPQPNAASGFAITANNLEIYITYLITHNNSGQSPSNYLLMARESQGVTPFPTFGTPAFDDGVLLANDTYDGAYAQFAGDGLYIQNLLKSGPINQSGFQDGLKSGVKYDFIIYPYTKSASYSDDNIDYGPPTSVTNYQIPVGSNSTLSGSPVSTTIASTINTAPAAQNVFTFTLTDGTGGGYESAPTKFSAVTIREAGTDNVPNWSSIIASAELYDLASPGTFVSASSITLNQLIFSGIPAVNNGDLGVVPRSSLNYAPFLTSTKTYGVRIYFKNTSAALTGVDNLRLAFTVANTDFTYATPAGTAGDHQASTTLTAGSVTSGINTITIDATKLVYTTNLPDKVGVKHIFATAPVIEAYDVNNNLDVDFTGETISTSNGAITFTTTNTFIAGKLTLSNFVFNDPGLTKVIVSKAGITSATSTSPTGPGGNTQAIISAYTAVAQTGVVSSIIPSITTFAPGVAPSIGQQNASSLANLSFIVTDDSGVPVTDDDGLPTRINSVTLTQNPSNGTGVGGATFDNWQNSIAGAELSVGGVNVGGTATINTNSIVFAGIPNSIATNLGFVADGGSRTYVLKIYFQNPINIALRDIFDSEDFVFQITNATDFSLTSVAGNYSSTLNTITPFNSGDGFNKVAVVASQLDFITQWAANANQDYDAPLTPTPTAKARDANQNLDTGFNSGTTVAGNPTITYPLVNSAVTVLNGLLTFSSTIQVSSSAGGSNGATTNLVLTSGALTGSSNIFKLNYSGSSDIVRDNSFTYPTNILYAAANNQVADITNATGIAMERFTVRDGGASNDSDGSATKLTAITLNVTNWQNLKNLALYDGATEIKDLDVASSINTITGDIIFSAFTNPFSTPDNNNPSATNLTIKATFKGLGVVDNQIVTFRVVSVTAASVASSQFLVTSPVGIQSSVSNNQNKIEVVATQIIYTTVPATASISVPIAVTVQAQDAFLNLDADYNGASSIPALYLTTGNTADYSVLNLPSGNFVGGILNYPGAFQFTSGTTFTQLVINGGAANTTASGPTASVDAGAITGISPAPGIDVKTSFESAVVADPTFPAFATPPAIGYVNFQENSDIQNSGTSYELLRTLLVDGSRSATYIYNNGSTSALLNTFTDSGDSLPDTDSDAATTTLTSVTIRLYAPYALRRIALYSNGLEIPGTELDATTYNNGTGVITNATAFYDFTWSQAQATATNPILVTAPDNGQVPLSVRVSFKNTFPEITDGDVIKADLTAAIVGTGSKFFNGKPANSGIGIAGNVGPFIGGQTHSGGAGTIGTIDVVATSLDFTTQPSAFAGVNEPIIPANNGGATGVVQARDTFANLDTGFNFGYTITAPLAGITLVPTAFTAGILDLTGMQYNSTGTGSAVATGNGTLTIVANGINSNTISSVNSKPCTRVDVIDVGAFYNPNSVASGNLKGGTTAIIFGVDISPSYFTSTFRGDPTDEPSITSLSFSFDVGYQTTSATTFTNFYVYESTNGLFVGSTLITNIGGTITKAKSASAPVTTTYDLVNVSFATPRPLYTTSGQASTTKTYFLVADISNTATSNTPKITPRLIDAGANDNSIAITQGSAKASVIAPKAFSFASTNPPSLVGSTCTPFSGQLNVDPNIVNTGIDLTFDVPVLTFDGYAELWERGVNQSADILISVLKATNGIFVPGNALSSATVASLHFDFKSVVTLQADRVYYVKIPQGTFDPTANIGTGVSDDQTNLYGGISYNGTMYFKIASNYPPKMVDTDLAKYDVSATVAVLNASFDQKGKASYLILNKSKYTGTPTSSIINNPTVIKTGVINSSTLSPTITGSGTLFLTELAAGDLLKNTSGTVIGKVLSIGNNVSLTLTSNAEINTINTAYETTAYDITHTGTITTNTGSTLVTGIGTSFTTELALGNTIKNGSGTIIGTVQAITNNTNITLANNALINASGIKYYESAVLAFNKFDITQLSPNAQYFTVSGNWSSAITYDVWIYAQNDALPTPFNSLATSQPFGKFIATGNINNFKAGSAGPTFSFVRPLNPGTPIYQICPNSYSVLSQPIIITEGATNKWAIGNQDFNILLPTGFDFDVKSTPTITLVGGDISTPTFKFINSTILNIGFTSNTLVAIDRIVIADLRVIPNSTSASGDIVRFGGSGLSGVPDLTKFATISANALPSQAFTNSYTIYNDFVSSIKLTSVVTSIPDNFLDQLYSKANEIKLLPTISPANDFNASFFSGTGVSDDKLGLTSIAKNTAFNITMTHTDLNGCFLSQKSQYLVYDNTKIIPVLTNSVYGPKQSLINVNFKKPSDVTNPATPLTPTQLSVATLGNGDIAGYKLDSMVLRIPKEATPASQIIYGAAWQSQLDKVLFIAATTSGGAKYRDYKWDYAHVLNAKSESLGGVTKNPYDNFIQKTPGNSNNYTGGNQDYYTGGSLGFVDFIGRFQSQADLTVIQPLVQRIELFVPPIPIIEVIGQSKVIPATSTSPDIYLFCELGSDIVFQGYPAASPGKSTASYKLFDDATDAPLTGTGFTDNANSNGTGTLKPNSANYNNGNKTIRVEYTYQDSKSPSIGKGKFYIQIAPNPVADFTFTSTGPNAPNASTANSICVNNEITFIPNVNNVNYQYLWNFADGTANSKAISPVHTYAKSLTYQASLNFISDKNCPSIPAVGSPVGSTVKSVVVGDLPIIDFSFLGNCVGDQISFTDKSKTPTGGNSNPSKADWDFGDGATTIGTTAGSTSTHAYGTAKSYSVTLTSTTDLGCKISGYKYIGQLPKFSPSQLTSFDEKFDAVTKDGGWITLDINSTNSVPIPVPFPLPLPVPAPAAGVSSWKYDATKENWTTTNSYAKNEKSALYSACLDLSTIPRPVISFDGSVNLQIGEGLVLQYSTDNLNIQDPTKNWQVLGTLPSGNSPGLDWYNLTGLPSNPGTGYTNSQNASGLGWATDLGAIKPKHKLEDVGTINSTRVILRFAFSSLGSGGNGTTNGVTIDNIRVGSRTRTVLFENFTTTDAGSASSPLNAILKSEADSIRVFTNKQINSTQLVNVNYHIGFLGKDPFNALNPADPSSRALYYNVSQVPFAYLDGKHNQYKNSSELFQNWGKGAYDLQTLNLANADFLTNNTTAVSNNAKGTIEVDVNVIPAKDMKGGTTLYIGVLEASILRSQLTGTPSITTGETQFDYVLRAMLPNAIGTKYPSNTFKNGVPVHLGPNGKVNTTDKFTWVADKFYSNNLSVVVFLQDSTKEVYQAELFQNIPPPAPPNPVTGIEQLTPESVNLYPNPANQEFTIELPRALRSDATVRMIDQVGQTIDAGVLPTGKNTKTVSTFGLASGVYIVEILSDEGSIVRKKVIVVH